jgi:predicted outer membrane protein
MRTETAVTINRKGSRSRCAEISRHDTEITGHVGPKHPQWRNAFCASTQPAAASAAEQRLANTALRELQGHNDQLEREMRRKDRALAEAAALLILQKKFQALVLKSQSEDI